MNRKQNKLNPLRLAAAYLLLLTVVSTGISFASYSTSVDVQSNSAGVAAFGITTTLQNSAVTLDTTNGDQSNTQTFSVTNSSEVAVNCTLKVSGIPDGVTVTSNIITGNVSNNMSIPVGVLVPGAASGEITLTFTVPKETEISATDISITVNAVQVD